MKILHIADTHLGYSAYRKVTDEGINQREQDTYDAFKQFIDYAIQVKPDLILHAGDLFDSVRPTNRAITFALAQIFRLSEQKIPFVVIAGNHEHPKLRETGHIFSIFDHINYVYPVYNARYEPVSFTIQKKQIVVHAIPQCPTSDDFNNNIKKLAPDSSADYNIVLTHGIVKGIKEFSMNEFDELVVPTDTLHSQFDYLALGHYHKYTKVLDNVFYPGSPERFTFADANEEKGFIELNGTKTLHPNFIALKTRPMIDAPPIDCADLSLDDVMNRIKKTIKVIEPQEKIFRLFLNHIPSHIFRGIDYRLIRELSKGAVHYELKTAIDQEENMPLSGSTKIGSLIHEFELFLGTQQIPNKNTILTLGADYIEKREKREGHS